MNQPLKFRLWDAAGENYEILDLGELAASTPIVSERQVDQFTGLKDKFNQEIYQGDILLCKDDKGDFYHQPVEFTMRECLGGEEQDDAGYLQIPQNREVVGNIRQSPELCPEKEYAL